MIKRIIFNLFRFLISLLIIIGFIEKMQGRTIAFYIVFGFYVIILSTAILFEFIKLNYSFEKLKNEILYALKKAIDMSILIATIIWLFYALNKSDLNQNEIIAERITDYSLLCLTVFFLNYFGTASKYIRGKLEDIIISFSEYLSKYFIFNILCLILIMELHNNKNILMAILGSFIFFILTETNKIYDDKRNKISENDKNDIAFHSLLNIVVIYILRDLFYFLNCTTNSIEINAQNIYWSIMRIIIFLLLISNSYFKDKIKIYFNHLIKTNKNNN